MVVVAFAVVIVLVYVAMIVCKLIAVYDNHSSIETYKTLRDDREFIKKIGG